eukprot:m.284740 g.284740  ORF g.284740 m.284740 type:complete len:327 (-) comp19425_c2_seq2:26-1006(-)
MAGAVKVASLFSSLLLLLCWCVQASSSNIMSDIETASCKDTPGQAPCCSEAERLQRVVAELSLTVAALSERLRTLEDKSAKGPATDPAAAQAKEQPSAAGATATDPAAAEGTDPPEPIAVDKSKYTELLLGCGSKWEKRIPTLGTLEWRNLVTLDYNDDHNPNVVWDLTQLPLPFADNSFDEIHAYEVLEHTGQQGDWKFFFRQWSEFWRILKPGGVVAGTCPDRTSPWAWGDPSHTRIVQPENFVFLSQREYATQVGKTPMSDFRFVYQADFDFVWHTLDGSSFRFVLEAVKPSRLHAADPTKPKTAYSAAVIGLAQWLRQSNQT